MYRTANNLRKRCLHNDLEDDRETCTEQEFHTCGKGALLENIILDYWRASGREVQKTGKT